MFSRLAQRVERITGIGDIGALRKALQAQTEMLSESEEKRKSLEEELRKKDAEIEELKNNKYTKELRENISKLEAELQRKNKELEERESEIQTLKKLQGKVNEIEARLQGKIKELEEAQGAMERHEKELLNLNRRIEEATKEHGKLLSELKSQNEKLVKDVALKDAAISELRFKENALRVANQELSGKYKKRSKKIKKKLRRGKR